MPLIIMSGIPCSGKTTVAKKLAAFLEREAGKKVDIVNEESLNLNKQASYRDTNIEKSTRALLRAAVDRLLQRDTVVIFDSLNYIKGYRYEIYCMSRALGTPQCIVYCNTPVETAREWNKKRTDGFDDTLYVCHTLPHSLSASFTELAQRFETPNAAARWDDPLFTVTPGEEPPCAAIRAALFDRQGPKPNIATAPQVLTDTSYVHELDRTTQEIITHIASASASALPGDIISLPKTNKKLTLSRKLPIAELQRLKRQFLKLSSLHQPTPQQVADSFAEFLIANI